MAAALGSLHSPTQSVRVFCINAEITLAITHRASFMLLTKRSNRSELM